MLEDKKDGVPMTAGWIYLMAAPFRDGFLIALFILLGHNGSLDFDSSPP